MRNPHTKIIHAANNAAKLSNNTANRSPAPSSLLINRELLLLRNDALAWRTASAGLGVDGERSLGGGVGGDGGGEEIHSGLGGFGWVWVGGFGGFGWSEMWVSWVRNSWGGTGFIYAGLRSRDGPSRTRLSGGDKRLMMHTTIRRQTQEARE